ncbi:hypothetical protein [Neosynechococcus sphagnicola]|uniref:hypothetical protein n=1 Tax=Neosynechococcus sphagnicola TaxID=1501145 RepID=UPI00055B01D6|nr:hypothetical protein [Neosynechococcus sphagnicola]
MIIRAILEWDDEAPADSASCPELNLVSALLISGMNLLFLAITKFTNTWLVALSRSSIHTWIKQRLCFLFG